MRHDDAPPVIYPVGRAPWLSWLLITLWLAGVAAASGVWASEHDFQWHQAVLLAASVVISAAACLTFWSSQRECTLIWDGERWSLEQAGLDVANEVRPLVRMDIQRALLLCLEQPMARRPIWLWAEAAHDSARWHLLRCALYSSASSTVIEPPVDEYPVFGRTALHESARGPNRLP
jgi:hypothetical protein